MCSVVFEECKPSSVPYRGNVRSGAELKALSHQEGYCLEAGNIPLATGKDLHVSQRQLCIHNQQMAILDLRGGSLFVAGAGPGSNMQVDVIESHYFLKSTIL